ncbi:aspartate ammonia-lyase [Desulforhopalus singaporensis]|uniref:Aspartate ammonia-lyase n=1 Tax=Desulforhopalus singaporensis TaxID=91360 RepID=A0A1H0SJG3_9BACT|nr:aspartate ammonia-lyase [Desulforhopalus singaporensis]SDP41931.1 aspartate ammonia-lyase [Desulforhopalus singaporensis]
MKQTVRIEHDFLGEKEIPDNCYYGIQTRRAVENFRITGIRISAFPELIVALACVKKAAAMVNAELGQFPDTIATAIIKACDEIIDGKLLDQFVVDIMQGGAGTSTNMNANEVIANRALELMGHRKGEYGIVHPNNHVNCSQSTNDVYPTALRVAIYRKLEQLQGPLNKLQASFQAKAEEFSDVLKMGRTQLQDAVPMTLGQEFSAYSTTIGEEIKLIGQTKKLVREINLGATAIGTGINSPDKYKEFVAKRFAEVTGVPVLTSANLVEATWDTGAYVQTSSVLKRIALKLSKISSDLRLLSSGPRAGLNEINLPRMQPGSSIMPGKVNPVIPEVVNQVAYKVIGNDLTITMASENGQLELNVMEPVIASSLFESMNMIIAACDVLRISCIDGITANRDHCLHLVENSIGIVTALTPVIGYENGSTIAREALATGKSVYEVAVEHNLLSRKQLDELMSIKNMV